jgi:hypothetical protein
VMVADGDDIGASIRSFWGAILAWGSDFLQLFDWDEF